MSKNDDDPMKKILERRQFIEDEQDDIPVQAMNDEFDDIPSPTSAGKKSEPVTPPTKPVKGPTTTALDLESALRKQMGNFKIPSVPEKQSKELDGEDAWADEPLEESRQVVREETPVKKEPGKINANSGLFSKVAGLFGGGQKKEEPKVGTLNPEAIKALANAKAEDLRQAAEREELPGESRVSVTSAELQKGSDIPIPPPMMEPPPAPPLSERRASVAIEETAPSLSERRASVAIEETAPSLSEKRVSVAIEETAPPLSEKRASVAIEEIAPPLSERRATTVGEIPTVKGNKDLDIIITDLEELQQDVSGKIGPKNAKELASKIDKIKEDYNAKSGEEQTKTLYKNLQSLKDWSSEKGKETNDKSTWKKIGTVISSCMSLVAAKIAGKEVETIKNNLAQAMKELKTQGKKEVVEGLSKINTKAAENQRSR
jgi:hypothetical protein